MSANFKFYITSTFSLLLFSFLGYKTGAYITGNYLENAYHLKGQTLGLDTLGVGFVIIAGGLVGIIMGLIVFLIFMERLSRGWGPKLSSGSHPALKITGLSFLTFLGILVALLFLIPTNYSKPKTN